MQTLGERIRKIRQEKKMTLEALAGDRLTKGMLSLIENNKANPSMDSLAYIADQLKVTVHELLQEVSSTELQHVLEQVETLYHKDDKDPSKSFEEVTKLIKPYLPHLHHGYEAARLLELFGRCSNFLKREEWESYLERAATIYSQMKITNQLVGISTFRAFSLFKEMKYAQSLQLFLKERAEIEANHSYIDPLTSSELDYSEAVFLFAVEKYDEAFSKIKAAVASEMKEEVFSNIHYLFTLAIAHAFITNNMEQFDYYLNKLKHYCELSENERFEISATYLKVHQLNSFLHHYEEALQLIEEFEAKHTSKTLYQPYYYLEKGKALFGLKRYEEALAYLEKVELPNYVFHPFDLSIFYEVDAYIARCYVVSGNQLDALRAIDRAMKNIGPMPTTPYKDAIHETYKMIVSITKGE